MEFDPVLLAARLGPMKSRGLWRDETINPHLKRAVELCPEKTAVIAYRTDVAQSESRLAAGRSQVLTAEANYKSSAATYRQVIGSEPGRLTPAEFEQIKADCKAASHDKLLVLAGYAITFNANLNRWVAAGAGNNTMVYSNDGISWSIPNQVFASNCYGVGSFYLLPGQTAPPAGSIFISSNLNNVNLNGTFAVASNSSIVVSGNLNVTGDLLVFGNWTLNQTALVQVTGTVQMSAHTIINPGSFINTTSLVLTTVSSLLINLAPGFTFAKRSFSGRLISTRSTATVDVASYSTLSGSYASVTTSDPCIAATPTYGANTLSCTLSPAPGCSSTLPPDGVITVASGGPASRADVGMIVGASVGAVVGAAVIVFVEYFASIITPERWPLILGAIFVVSIMYFRAGLGVGHLWPDRPRDARGHVLHGREQVHLVAGAGHLLVARRGVEPGLHVVLLRRRDVLDAAQPDVVVGDHQAVGRDERARAAVHEAHGGETHVVEPLLARLEPVALPQQRERRVVEGPHALVRQRPGGQQE